MTSRCTFTTILFSTLMLVSSLAISDHHERIATIHVTGEGEVAIAPDMAAISVGVVREGKTARAALTANNNAMVKVLEAMKAEGIANKDLQTSGFNISPRYFYPPREKNHQQKPPKIVGYTVSNNLAVRIRDLEKVGGILDRVVTLGVNSGGNIRFMNDNSKQVLKQARKAAMADAIDKAETLADAAGVDLGRILEISENSRSPRPMPMARAKFRTEAMMADAVPVAGGENTYHVTVNVNWEISQ
ncbi:MAG: hypothetical protein COA46_07725 [Porticoccaceae bacterium]|nr:MAG: hypothetical protein COA46_07725 [Porticoccaceae bacterium]